MSVAQRADTGASRQLRIAIAQMRSDNHDIDGNLARAEALAEEAARRGARLVLFPELMPSGYSLYYDVWDSAERGHGKTSLWLAATSRRLGVWLGTGAGVDDRRGRRRSRRHHPRSRSQGAAREVCSGFGIAELAIGGPAGVASVARTQVSGARSYASNPQRPIRARAISG